MHGIKIDVFNEMKKLFPKETEKLLKIIDNQETEICDLQELVVKYAGGIFGEDCTANCGECKHYELQIGQEDNSEFCYYHEDSCTMLDLETFEECDGFEVITSK